MLAAARHSAILAEVQRERIVRVADLAKMLGVSLMTVRRDIEALDEAGAVEKIHGGAKLPGGAEPHCRDEGCSPFGRQVHALAP